MKSLQYDEIERRAHVWFVETLLSLFSINPILVFVSKFPRVPSADVHMLLHYSLMLQYSNLTPTEIIEFLAAFNEIG